MAELPKVESTADSAFLFVKLRPRKDIPDG
jgi:hypothetical protein